MKRAFVVAVVFLSFTTTNAAWAQGADRRFYAGGFGGLNIASDRDGASEDGMVTTLTELSPGFSVGGFFGYRLPTHGDIGVRIEGEFAFRSNDVDRFEVFGMEPGINEDAMFTTAAGMGNVLVDFLIGGHVSPYGGGGLGIADVYTDLRYGAVDHKNRGTAFAWQVMGGVTGTVNHRIDVFGEVRYFAASEADVDRVTPGGTTAIRLKAEDASVHGGIRINF